MLDRFDDSRVFIQLPFNDFLNINVHGKIIDNVGNVFKDFNGNYTDVKYFNGIKISVIVACLFKKVRIPYNEWFDLDIYHLDDDVCNLNPSNLIIRVPFGGKRVLKLLDYFYIPGFTRYAINKSGTVVNIDKGNVLSPYQDSSGYWMYGVQPDVGVRTIVGMHRLLALAFLEYPKDVDRLDVNHVNGIKSDNNLNNLEWATRKRNCDHAYSTGLRNDNISVQVKNVVTGEVVTFYSFEDCARKMGLDGETVRLRTKTSGQVLYRPHHLFKQSNDNSCWKEVVNVNDELCRAGLASPLYVKNTITGEEFEFPSITKCSDFLKLKTPTLAWRLKNNLYDNPINGFVVKRL